MKKIAAWILSFALAAAAFAEAPTELSLYLIGNPTQAYRDALAEFNKKAQADLNVTLKVTFIGWGDFSQKYPLVLASGEPIDLIYTSTWLQFAQQALKGAFMPLETLGPKYAPSAGRPSPPRVCARPRSTATFTPFPRTSLSTPSMAPSIGATSPRSTVWATSRTSTTGAST
jgi:hypothetical protein